MNNDLISRSALKKSLEVTQYNDIDDLIRTERLIDNAPTVEITDYDTGYQDGLEDGLNDIRPQGEWITENLEEPYGKCNQCGEICEVDNFCGNCGADMRGNENER